MPHVTVPIAGSCCHVTVQVGPGERLRELCKSQNTPAPSAIACRALIDTGAMITCIDPGVLSRIAHVPKSRKPVLTASTGATPTFANTFDAAIYLVHPGHQSFPGSGYVLTHEFEALETSLTAQGIEVLLGMDVLRRCLFVVDGPHERFILGI